MTSIVPLPSHVHNSELQTSSVNLASSLYNITYYLKYDAGYGFSEYISFNGTYYSNSASALYPAGNYTAIAIISGCPDLRVICYDFSHWNSTGGVAVVQSQQLRTNVTVTGSGSLTAYFHAYNLKHAVQPFALLFGVSTTLILMVILRRARRNEVIWKEEVRLAHRKSASMFKSDESSR